jgi:hypothetical protein
VSLTDGAATPVDASHRNLEPRRFGRAVPSARVVASGGIEYWLNGKAVA